MKGVDLSKLPNYLQQQRWFGSKNLPIKNVAVVDHVEIDIKDHPARANGAFVVAIIEVTYELGAPERYQLLVCPRPDGTVAGALDDDEFARELLRFIREGRSLSGGAGALRGKTFPGSQSRLSKLSASPQVRRITEEQSNTSVVFDDQTILKVIRRIEAGLNPELEMGRFLSAHPSFKGAPALLGAIELEGPVSATLGVMHEYVLAENDGWKYMLNAFRAATSPSAALLQEVRKLGVLLGQLHLMLGSDPADPAFAPEPIQQEDLQRWSSSIIGELGVTLAEAERRIPELGDSRDPLVERAKRLAQVAASGKKIRLHGDLHLGQVLRVRGDWMIFDFEGEPARNFNQRREKHTVLKDVAGMLRSFSYAQAAVELSGAPSGARAAPCREAFLAGYLEVLQRSDLLPSEKDTFRIMLDALELERTIYELRYELQNRPDWIRIPVRTLQEMGTPL